MENTVPARSAGMSLLSIKRRIETCIPKPLLDILKKVIAPCRRLQAEWPLIRFQFFPKRTSGYIERRLLCRRMRAVHRHVVSLHTHAQVVAMVEYMLQIPKYVEGCIVEAGCYKGGSTAKLSLAARICGRQLFVFDSFAGIPENPEAHTTNLLGDRLNFHQGLYRGELDEVKNNVRQFGALESCEFIPGWFEETMPHFSKTIVMAFIDVDLASSTRTCLKYLYPRLVPGGTIFSHDGYLPLCIAAIADDRFWNEDIGYQKPPMPDLGKKKLLRITKPYCKA